MTTRRWIRPGTRIAVPLSDPDRDLILNETFQDGEVAERIRLAPLEGARPSIRLTLDDLDELMGFVAAAANHATKPALQRKLYRLYDRLTTVFDSYTDEGPPR